MTNQRRSWKSGTIVILALAILGLMFFVGLQISKRYVLHERPEIKRPQD